MNTQSSRQAAALQHRGPTSALLATASATVVAAAITVLASAGNAHAAVGPATTTGPDGTLKNIAYGSGGNVFELIPQLYMQGLGNARDPLSVTALNPLLSYSFSVSGAGSALMQVDYQVQNTSSTDSFAQLRFMVYANPDGDGLSFADVLSQTWGAAAGGDPVRREGRAFSNPADTLLSRFQLNNNLTELPSALDAACTAAPGCDATLGLQWNADLLGPGETFHVRLGLSDNGQALSSRWIDATAVNSANTVLTLSGFSEVIAVPEPSAAWLLLAGLASIGRLIQRRRAE